MRRRLTVVAGLGAIALAAAVLHPARANAEPDATDQPTAPRSVGTAVAADVTAPLRDMPPIPPTGTDTPDRPDLDAAPPKDSGHTPDGALSRSATAAAAAVQALPAPLVSFEGLANTDHPTRRVSPPDPVGDVGRDHYVEMVNLTFAIYSKTGTRLYGPATLASLWQGFFPACAGDFGDPIVLYDEIANRWLLTQFTSTGPEYFNCVALSTTEDPLGSYYRYAFSTGANFPDYPKYGVWPDGYYITTREFDPDDNYAGVGVYALDRRQMITGNLNPRIVSFFLDRDPLWEPGDGLLPADLDGARHPPAGSPMHFAGTMDDDFGYGAPFDAVNLFQARIKWAKPEESAFVRTATLPTAEMDTVFPCAGRACIPQPGTTNRVDILSYRQRPLHRLVYRNFGRGHEVLLTNQSVEALPGIAGIRWWEIRNPATPVIHQEGTFAPEDGVHRWMGSAAMDRAGNIAIGYSVSSPTVFPGIRYAGRTARAPLGTLGGEASLIEGSGSQLTSQRWGDYTSLNVDPFDHCTFWYVNEYYAVSSTNLWQTRIGAFRFPNCT